MYISITFDKVEDQRKQLDGLFDKFERNPLFTIEYVDYGFENEDKYNRTKAIEHLINSEDKTIKIEKTVPNYSRGTITTDVPVPFIDFVFADDVINTEANLTQIIKYTEEWTDLQGFLSLATSADDRDNDFFYRQLKLLPVPQCLGNALGWYHVVSPRGYEPFFKREDLLNAPAYQLEELDDGAICLMTYPHPLEFGTQENTQRLIELSSYLYHKWMEHAPLPESLRNQA